MTPAEVIALIIDAEVKFVDFRFTDTRGKEQHVTIPTSEVNEDFFEDGKMFDGSSIAGWKGINESDMILMPDDSTVFPPDVVVITPPAELTFDDYAAEVKLERWQVAAVRPYLAEAAIEPAHKRHRDLFAALVKRAQELLQQMENEN